MKFFLTPSHSHVHNNIGPSVLLSPDNQGMIASILVTSTHTDNEYNTDM